MPSPLIPLLSAALGMGGGLASAGVEETQVIETWIYSRISADLTMQGLIGNPVRAFAYQAPQGAAFPYLVFGLTADEPLMVANGKRVWLLADYEIKTVGQGVTLSNMSPILARLDDLLHRQEGSVIGGTVISCMKGEPIKTIGVEVGIQYPEFGAFYRFQAQLN